MGGSTLDLDFSHGLAFSHEVYRHSGFTVHPMKHRRPFIMVIYFGRHVFRLSPDTVAAALESVIGGSAIEFRVSQITDSVFSFKVSCMQVGFHILELRSFKCSSFKCFFHLWGHGGPNWRWEFALWKKQCDAEWIIVSPSKRRASLGLMAMHSRPLKSSLKSGSFVRKKLSFASLQQYEVCKGYRYPVSHDELVTLEQAGYPVPSPERIIISAPPPAELRWTAATPHITFGTVSCQVSSPGSPGEDFQTAKIFGTSHMQQEATTNPAEIHGTLNDGNQFSVASLDSGQISSLINEPAEVFFFPWART